jgi:hypothetical protein
VPRSVLRAPDIRFKVDPGDVPADKVARRLHLSLAAFEALKPRLFMRGFPRPDPDTEMYDLEAIDRWRHGRHPAQFPELTGATSRPTLEPEAKSMADLAREGHARRRRGRGVDAGEAPERHRNG